MRNFMQMLKLEQLEAEKGGGGGGKSATPPAAAKPPVSDNSPAEDDKFDDLGYEKTPAASASEGEKDETGKAGKEPEPAAAADDKEITPASGYSDDPSKVEDPEPEPAPKADDIDLGYELKTEGLPADEVAKLKDFLKKNGATKEIAQALMDLRKSELKAADETRVKAEEAAKKEQAETRKRWMKELKDDPVFGGEKYGFNVKRAERVIEEFMPGTKKVLTERKSMLPPYVMRDLARLADHLWATEGLKTGNPPAPSETEEEQDDALAFYNS